jgi:hypothetical protein
MKVISCDYPGYCFYRAGTIRMLPWGWSCIQEYYQYERIPLDQMMMEARNVYDIHDMDSTGNS